MLEFEYARAALKNGLQARSSQLGTNPYKFGMIGSSDAHTGLAAMEEDNFFGKTAPQEPSPERMTKAFFDNAKTGVKIMDWEVGASGYAAVWATENTREAIFDAMKRRETYATTGPRMAVRFFGGWDFDADGRDTTACPAAIGYAKGVPMGGDLDSAPNGKAPSFLVAALKDADRRQPRPHPDRQGLGRHGRQDAGEGLRRGLVAAIASRGANGKLPAVGSTVDIANATWTNTIGAPELIAVWKDPRFRRRASAPSTTPACSRSRRRAGLPTTPSASA